MFMYFLVLLILCVINDIYIIVGARELQAIAEVSAILSSSPDTSYDLDQRIYTS